MRKSLWPVTGLLLIFWISRIAALELLPLHNDEGLHLTRAVEVWNLHPFWEISDGKIINHWPIAVFYPQHAPVFTGRIPTIFMGMLGLTAAYALTRQHFGFQAAVMSGSLWTASPYLFFYERTAFSDAEAGAWVVLTLWAALRLAREATLRSAVITGLMLALAALFKFTAVPFTFVVVATVLLWGKASLRNRLLHLVVVALVVVLCFVPPLAYLALRGRDFFTIALGWIGGGSGSAADVGGNLARLSAQLTEFGVPLWSAAMIAGLALLPLMRPKLGGILLLALGVPLASIMLLGTEVLSRHYVVALPLALTLGGAGLGVALQRIRFAVPIAVIVLAIGFIPFAWGAYQNPADLPLPADVRAQHISDHSAGYGLREAAESLAALPPDIPVIASMFPDSCRRANFYTLDRPMICTDAPGGEAIETALAQTGQAYVMVDDAPNIGIDITTLDSQAEQIAIFPRPGEDSAVVVLWRLTR